MNVKRASRMNDEQRRTSLLDRMNAKRFVTDSGCWEYTGAISPLGYARVNYDGGARQGHRVYYQCLHNKSLSPSEYLLHTCDNRKCFNPEHLVEGTALSNIRDAMTKGRKEGKLTPELAESLKADLAAGEMLQKDIAIKYNVCDAIVSRIKQGKIWR